jgi:hypothetical protein
MLYTQNIIIWGPSGSSALPGFDPGNKKAPTHKEKGLQNGCALLIFPKLMMLELELAPVTGT